MADSNRVYLVVEKKYKGRREAYLLGMTCGEKRDLNRKTFEDAVRIYPYTNKKDGLERMEQLNELFIKEGTMGNRGLESRNEFLARTDVCRDEDGCPRAFIMEESAYGDFSVQLYPGMTCYGLLPYDNIKKFKTKEEALTYIDSARERLVDVGFNRKDVNVVPIYEGSVKEYLGFVNECRESPHRKDARIDE